MADRQKEREIVERARARGWTDEQIKQAILAYRAQTGEETTTETPTTTTETKQSRLGEAISDIKAGAISLGQSLKKRGTNIAKSFNRSIKGEQSPLETSLQTVGQLAGGAGDVLFEGALTAGKAALPKELEEKVPDILRAAAKITSAGMINDEGIDALISAVGQGAEAYGEWKKTHQRAAANIESIINIGSLFPVEKALASGVRATGRGLSGIVRTGTKKTGELAGIAGRTITESPTAQGLGRGLGSLTERVPRAVKRGSERIGELAEEATILKTATPATQQTIKSGIEQPTIKLVQSFDTPTLKDARTMHELAESNIGKTPSRQVQPARVAADKAVEQFDIIQQQKRSIGELIGEASQRLSKTQSVSVDNAVKQIDDIFKTIGVESVEKGKLQWGADTNLIPSEQRKIQELYNEAMKGLENPTPSIIHKRDQLFSKLKRESRMEDIGEILITLPDGSKKSIFDAFRDIFSSALDDVSPEMRALNKQYAQLKQLTDDVEDSIFRAPNFNVARDTDPARFAEKNLRRLISDAQSAPVYQEIAERMDTLARQLGYEGANPYDLIDYAEILRRLYPDSIPKAGFAGGIKTGLSGLTDTALGVVSKLGKTNIQDQRQAIKNLIEESLGLSTKKTGLTGLKKIQSNTGKSIKNIDNATPKKAEWDAVEK